MMIKAILLDMDNTLLINPDMAFARAFLEIFEQHFAAAGFENATDNFRRAIQAMSREQMGNRSNTQLTLEMLSGGDIERAKATLDSFYADVYPQLKNCIAAVDGASELIYQLREMGYDLVIATNPIYPETAIRQRMTWAGLPQDENLYTLITSADNMHFAKPDPAYYAEILGRVGVEPDEVLMVGDSMKNDIIPGKSVV